MDFEDLKLKEFEYWDLFLHENQYPYIGRSYAWATNNSLNCLNRMLKIEREELFDKVIPSWEKAIHKEFGPARTNLAIFGNTEPHLHAHLIPRYRKEIEFLERKYQDPNPSGNYAPYPKIEMPKSELFKIRDAINRGL